MQNFVYGVSDRKEMIEKIKAQKGNDYFDRLKLKSVVTSEPVSMGL